MKIILTGSTGLIGSELVPFLKLKGHTVKKLVRQKQTLAEDEILWNPSTGQLELKELEGFDAVINLAGENIADGRWNEEKKQRILDSRIASTRLLCHNLIHLENPPKVLINASAIGFYGDRGEEELDEKSASGTKSFISKVCREWEAATAPAMQKGIRVVCLRTGMVLSEKGGALAKMLIPFKIGLGGVLGTGEQYISWIALDDLLEVIYYVLTQEGIEGPVNAVSPYPVNNKDFTKTLGHLLHRPTLLSMPVFAARLAFGEMADELLLSSAKVLPAELEKRGFQFKYPQLESALEHILGSQVS
jgi:uncharacterized protein